MTDRWLINIAAKRSVVEKTALVGTTTRRLVLLWEGSAWSGEELENIPMYRTGKRRPLSAQEARETLGEAASLIVGYRKRYQSERYTVPLESFGFP